MKGQKLISLENIPIAQLANVFNEAFTGYYVPINFTEEGMIERIKRARIDLRFSVGVLAEEELVAFMLTGLGQQAGSPTAYNAGTGVLEGFRGQGLVSTMYQFGIPSWRAAGCQRASLEVIVENERALKAYQRVGFQVGRRLTALKKDITSSPQVTTPLLRQVTQPRWSEYEHLLAFYPTWDYTPEGIVALGEDYTYYEWGPVDQLLQGFAIVHQVGRIAQAGIHPSQGPSWGELMTALATNFVQLSWVNIDVKATELLVALDGLGWKHIVDQYEMERPL